MDNYNRREVLAGIGAGITGLAGCTSENNLEDVDQALDDECYDLELGPEEETTVNIDGAEYTFENVAVKDADSGVLRVNSTLQKVYQGENIHLEGEEIELYLEDGAEVEDIYQFGENEGLIKMSLGPNC